jgi:hypothetical protein
MAKTSLGVMASAAAAKKTMFAAWPKSQLSAKISSAESTASGGDVSKK